MAAEAARPQYYVIRSMRSLSMCPNGGVQQRGAVLFVRDEGCSLSLSYYIKQNWY